MQSFLAAQPVAPSVAHVGVLLDPSLPRFWLGVDEIFKSASRTGSGWFLGWPHSSLEASVAAGCEVNLTLVFNGVGI